MENWCMPRTNYTILTSPTLWSKKVYEILNKCKLNHNTTEKQIYEFYVVLRNAIEYFGYEKGTYTLFCSLKTFIKNNTLKNLHSQIKNTDINKDIIETNKFPNAVLNECHYINLDKDAERKKRIQSYDFKLKTKRFGAIKDSYGHLGCTLSHITLLENLYNKNEHDDTYYMIVEDDIFISDFDKYNKYLKNIKNLIKHESVDMILLCGSNKILDVENNYGGGFYKCLRANTTTGYIVKRSFIPSLINKFDVSKKKLNFIKKFRNLKPKTDEWYELCNEHVEVWMDITDRNNVNKNLNCASIIFYMESVYCIDQIWTRNMIDEKWLINIDNSFIKQYSENTNVDNSVIEEKEKEKIESYFSIVNLVNKDLYELIKNINISAGYFRFLGFLKIINLFNNKYSFTFKNYEEILQYIK